MHTAHIWNVNNFVPQSIFQYKNVSVIWNASASSNVTFSFVGSVYLILFWWYAFHAYHIHALLLHTSAGKLKWLMNNGYLVTGFCTMSISDISVDEKEFVDNRIVRDCDFTLLPVEEVVWLMSKSGRRRHDIFPSAFLEEFANGNWNGELLWFSHPLWGQICRSVIIHSKIKKYLIGLNHKPVRHIVDT